MLSKEEYSSLDKRTVGVLDLLKNLEEEKEAKLSEIESLKQENSDLKELIALEEEQITEYNTHLSELKVELARLQQKEDDLSSKARSILAHLEGERNEIIDGEAETASHGEPAGEASSDVIEDGDEVPLIIIDVDESAEPAAPVEQKESVEADPVEIEDEMEPGLAAEDELLDDSQIVIEDDTDIEAYDPSHETEDEESLEVPTGAVKEKQGGYSEVIHGQGEDEEVEIIFDDEDEDELLIIDESEDPGSTAGEAVTISETERAADETTSEEPASEDLSANEGGKAGPGEEQDHSVGKPEKRVENGEFVIDIV